MLPSMLRGQRYLEPRAEAGEGEEVGGEGDVSGEGVVVRLDNSKD